MDEKDYEVLSEELETTKEVKTLKDLSVEAIENMESLYQTEFDENREEAEQQFEEKIETLEEEEKEPEEKVEEKRKKEKIFSKLLEKWKNLEKKKKGLVISAGVIILILLGLMIFFLVTGKKEDEIEEKEPDVVLEMGSYRYENGKLIFLSKDEEIGTYECENKNENLCKIAQMKIDDTMDITKKVNENEENLNMTSKIYFDRFVFLVDNKDEEASEIKLYDLKEEKVLKTVFEVMPNEKEDSLLILKDNEGLFGLERITESGLETIIPYSYDQMNFIPSLEDVTKISVRKDNNFYLANLENKILTKAITNTIVGASEKYIKTKDKNNNYHVYDYNAREVMAGEKNWEYVELLDEVMFLVEQDTLYIKDYEGNLMTNNTIGLGNKNYNPVEKYKDNKLKETKRAWSYEIAENNLTLTVYYEEEEETHQINMNEGKLSSKLAFMDYFDGTITFYSDMEKKTPIGKYECTAKNKVEKDTTSLTTCMPAKDTIYKETRNAKETEENKSGVIPIFGKQYMFIQDGDTIVLQDLTGNKTIAKYESVDTSSYTGVNDITFASTSNVAFIAKSASSHKFGVANITIDGVKPVIPFEKDNILMLGDYYVIEENHTYALYDLEGNKVTNDLPSPIVDYHKNYLKTLTDNQYFVHGFKEDISKDGYDYIELYDEYYAAVKKGRVHLYRYDDKEKYEYIYEEEKESGMELQTDKYYNNQVNAFRITIGKEIKVEIGGTNGAYKMVGTFPTTKVMNPIDEDEQNEE